MLDSRNNPGWADMSGATQPNDEGVGSGSHSKDRNFEIVDYQATQPRDNTNDAEPQPIPHSPNLLTLATLIVTIPNSFHKRNNRVELIATVGVEGITETSQLKFRIFRDGSQIFEAQAGVESDPASELFYIETFQAIDTNVRSGSHTYVLTVENATSCAEAAVVGPISFSALAIEGKSNKSNDFWFSY